jgi:hypothetical protein
MLKDILCCSIFSDVKRDPSGCELFSIMEYPRKYRKILRRQKYAKLNDQGNGNKNSVDQTLENEPPILKVDHNFLDTNINFV